MSKKNLSGRLLLWPLQLAGMILISLCATFLPLLFLPASSVLRVIFLWLLPPAFGAWSACRLARSGFVSFAAWIAPPVIHTIVPWITLGFPPSGLSMAVCALLSMTGAAAGDVLYRRDHA